MTNQQHIRYLLEQRLRGALTPDEELALTALLRDPGQDAELRTAMQELLQENDMLLPDARPEWDSRIAAILDLDRPAAETPHSGAIVLLMQKTRWWWAAAIILLLAGGAYRWLTRSKSPSNDIAVETILSGPDVPPGGNKAILTLSGGRRIILDSARLGSLAQQGGTQITKTDNGQLAYNVQNEASSKALYNTLSTPRGGQYQLTLPDGTKVWLNAASSITYPTAFIGKERTVTITGEVYLEVAANAHQPFHVKTTDLDVAVLGTSFNVNAYSDEPAIKTTLLEGAVKVTAYGKSQLMQSGQQTTVFGTTIDLNPHANTGQAIAWKNGFFAFEDTDLASLLRTLSRWYDINVVYQGAIPKRVYSGKIGRTLTLGQVLYFLTKTNVHYTIDDNRTLTITP